jgi:hypothetical protein
VRIVGVACYDTVGVGDQCALALGIVGNALEIESIVQEDAFQPAFIVVDRAQLAPLEIEIAGTAVHAEPRVDLAWLAQLREPCATATRVVQRADTRSNRE